MFTPGHSADLPQYALRDPSAFRTASVFSSPIPSLLLLALAVPAAATAAPPAGGASAPAATSRPAAQPQPSRAGQYALRPPDADQAPRTSFGLKPRGLGGDDSAGVGLGRPGPYGLGR